MTQDVTLRLVQIHSRQAAAPVHLFHLSTPHKFEVNTKLRCGGFRWTVTEVLQIESEQYTVGLVFAEHQRVYQNYVMRLDSGPMSLLEFDSATARLASLLVTLGGFDALNYEAALDSGMRAGHPMVELMRPFVKTIAAARMQPQPDLDRLQDILTGQADG